MIHNNSNNNIFVSGDLLQVRSHGSAPRYDVIRIVHGRSQRAPNMARTHANARGDLVLARMALGKCPQGGKMDLNNKSKKLVLGHPCDCGIAEDRGGSMPLVDPRSHPPAVGC